MSQPPREPADHGQRSDDESKARDHLFQLLMQPNLTPLLQANLHQSQLRQQQFLQPNPLINLQNSLSFAAAHNPSLSLVPNHLQLAPSPHGHLASTKALLRQLPPNGIQIDQSGGLAATLLQPAGVSSSTSASIPGKKVGRGNRDPAHAFPSRLHEILNVPAYNEYVAWLPHGRAWKILDKSQFEKKVIPHHFRHARYASFMRQVNGWGFKRLTEGPDHNAYYHEYFLRDYQHVCWKMQRPSDLEKTSFKKKKATKATASLDDASHAETS